MAMCCQRGLSPYIEICVIQLAFAPFVVMNSQNLTDHTHTQTTIETIIRVGLKTGEHAD